VILLAGIGAIICFAFVLWSLCEAAGLEDTWQDDDRGMS
jgi:hypothetical protein